MPASRQMKLGLNIVANGAHAAGWRMPGAQRDAAMDIRLSEEEIKRLEEPYEPHPVLGHK